MVTSSHVITTGLPNQLSIFSIVTPISSAKMPTANVAKNVVLLRACNLLGSTLVHPVMTHLQPPHYKEPLVKFLFRQLICVPSRLHLPL